VGFGISTIRLACLLLSVLALSCAQDGGPALVDARWNLTCPTGSELGCGSLAPDTCFGVAGQRAIVGEHRQPSCTGDPIIGICESVDRADGTTFISLVANVDEAFAFELTAVVDTNDESVGAFSCNVTIIEGQEAYDMGACGEDPPSMEQPCRLTNIVTEGGEVAFDLQCVEILSSASGRAFDVGGVGAETTRIRFQNCSGSF